MSTNQCHAGARIECHVRAPYLEAVDVYVALCGAHFLTSTHWVLAGFGDVQNLLPRTHRPPIRLEIAAVAADLVEGACE